MTISDENYEPLFKRVRAAIHLGRNEYVKFEAFRQLRTILLVVSNYRKKVTLLKDLILKHSDAFSKEELDKLR